MNVEIHVGLNEADLWKLEGPFLYKVYWIEWQGHRLIFFHNICIQINTKNNIICMNIIKNT